MRALKWWIIGLILACGSLILILQETFVTIRGEDDIRLHCASNLKQIYMAFDDYHHVNGRLPPPAITNKDGKPLLSWRVLVLPFVEEQRLYQEFHLDEPWDSPHNLPLLNKVPYVYASTVLPEERRMTHYQVIVGSGTPFEKEGLTWDDFPDGRSNTILIVDAVEAVPWTKPSDVNYNPQATMAVLGQNHQYSIHFSRYTLGAYQVFNAAFADGTIRFVRVDKNPESMRGFVTRNGGEALDWSKIK